MLITVLLLAGCNQKDGSGSESESEKIIFDRDASYALGMSVGLEWADNLEMSNIDPNFNELVKGFREAITGKDTRYNEYEAREIIEAAFSAVFEERNTALIQSENSFLAENSRKPGVRITSSGLQYEIVSEGTGRKPGINDTVQVHYRGTLLDGAEFDSSYERGEPTMFPLARVIPGWTEGLQLMNVGSNYILYIPSELGYGPDGITDPMTREHIIPPYATLIFDVVLIDIVDVEQNN